MHNFGKLIKHLENTKVSIVYYLMFFLFVISIRNFWEMFIYNSPIIFVFHWHYIVFYIALALALIIIMHFAIGSKIKKISRVILSGFIFIFLAPIFDYLISERNYYIEEYYIGYLEPPYAGSLWQRFFTFFGPYKDGAGVTPGIHFEMLILFIAIFLYVFIKKRSWFRAIITTLISYATIFVYFAAPYFINWFLKIFGLSYEYSEKIITNFFLLVAFILALVLFYLYSKKYFIAIFKDIRIFRLIHFELMFFVGALLALIYFPNKESFFNQEFLFYWIFLVIAIACAWIFSVITNNITDYNLDKINSPERPLTSNKIPMGHYRIMAVIFFLLACIYSLAVHFVPFMMIFSFMAFYFIYSMPPFRLKTVPILSKFIIAVNSLTMIMMGFVHNSGEIAIPSAVAIFVLLGFTAVINFIDIKDYEGDKAHGIKTLPTILGLKNSKRLIAIFMFLAYLLSYLLLKSTYLFVIFTLAGALQFYFITRPNYKEKPVFISYIISILSFIIYNWLNL